MHSNHAKSLKIILLLYSEAQFKLKQIVLTMPKGIKLLPHMIS